jgi:ketosteroid isomerase-like protein
VSQADIETLRAGYEAVSRGERDKAFRDAHPDFELKTADRVTNPGTYRGAEAARLWFEDLWEPFEEIVVEPQEFRQRGDRIAVVIVVRSRPQGSSALIENRIGQLWTFRDGKAIALEIFPDPREALEALTHEE